MRFCQITGAFAYGIGNMESWRSSGAILGASILIVAQYTLAFFIFKLPGLKALQWVGWGIWVLAQHWLVIVIGIVSMGLLYLEILAADQEGLDKFGDEYRCYMQRVPRANFLLGLIRLILRRGN